MTTKIDELIEKYNHEIKYLGLQGGALHIKKRGVKDLEALKEQLNTNVITDNSKVNENLLEENRQLKAKHKEDVVKAYADGIYRYNDYTYEYSLHEAEQHYQETHEKK